jgi:hypothetical protein
MYETPEQRFCGKMELEPSTTPLWAVASTRTREVLDCGPWHGWGVRFGDQIQPDGSFMLQMRDAKQRAADNEPLLAEAFEPWKHGMMALVGSTLMNRALFVSEMGWVGLVPRWAKPGDLICILFGCKVPVVLRRQEDHYQYIGERLVKLCLAS